MQLADILEARAPEFARLLRQEQGKVLPVLRYSDLSDAIARANSTDYGLGATPFRGAKQSGFGREMGAEGLEEFTQARIINIAV